MEITGIVNEVEENMKHKLSQDYWYADYAASPSSLAPIPVSTLIDSEVFYTQGIVEDTFVDLTEGWNAEPQSVNKPGPLAQLISGPPPPSSYKWGVYNKKKYNPFASQGNFMANTTDPLSYKTIGELKEGDGSIICENKVMKWYGYPVKTQKARGVLVLKKFWKEYSPDTAGLGVIDVKHLIDVENPTKFDWISYPKFARPCPVTPRHGFVESQVVHSKEELLEVIEQTKQADPAGEVMLMEYVQAKLNMVWTPSLLTIGSGHDGATGGKGVVTFPLSGQWDRHIQALAPMALVHDYPYVEAVIEGIPPGSSIFLTQLRNGPVMDSKPDFIPQAMTVTRIIQPDVKRGDLLEWETLMLGVKGENGVVVWHPTGSMGDHFAVHARSCGVACVTSFEPKIGDFLEQVVCVKPSYGAVVRGLVAGATVQFNQGVVGSSTKFEDVATTMLMGLHNSSAMEGDQAWWFGASVSLMLRLGSMALRGEARHLSPNKGARPAIYHKAAKMKMQAHQKRCNGLINIFRYGWSIGAKSIGGKAWAQCGLSLAELFNVVGEFVRCPDEVRYGALMRSFNVTVNQAHNGGWWLNKFIPKNVFEQAQEGSVAAALRATPLIYKLDQEYRGLGQERVDKIVEQWKRWETINLKPSRMLSVDADLPLNSNQLTIQIKDRLIGNLRAPLYLNIAPVYGKIPRGWPIEIGVVEEEKGVSVEMGFPGILEETITIWKEPALTAQSVIDNKLVDPSHDQPKATSYIKDYMSYDTSSSSVLPNSSSSIVTKLKTFTIGQPIKLGVISST